METWARVAGLRHKHGELSWRHIDFTLGALDRHCVCGRLALEQAVSLEHAMLRHQAASAPASCIYTVRRANTRDRRLCAMDIVRCIGSLRAMFSCCSAPVCIQTAVAQAWTVGCCSHMLFREACTLQRERALPFRVYFSRSEQQQGCPDQFTCGILVNSA